MKLSFKIIIQTLLIIFFVLLNFQMITIFGWIKEGEGMPLKLYHLFSLIFLFFLIKKPLKIKLKRQGLLYIYSFMGIVLLCAIVLYPIYGFNSIIINYCFAFYVFFIGLFISKSISEDEILSALQIAAIFVSIVVIIKNIYYYNELVFFLKHPYGHPSIYYLYGGGPNLEATWIALNALFFINKKRIFYFSLIFSFIISMIYASRVSIIMLLSVYLFYLISNKPTKKERNNILITFLFVTVFFGYQIVQKLSDLYVIKRFINFWSEGGSQGRIILYKAFAESYSYKSFFGVGPGNAIPYIEEATNKNFIEDNLHNYYLQVFLELGIFGLLILVLIIYDLIYKNLKIRFNSPFGILCLCYFIGCLIQFRGAEAIVWLCLGMFYGQFYFNKPSINN